MNIKFILYKSSIHEFLNLIKLIMDNEYYKIKCVTDLSLIIVNMYNIHSAYTYIACSHLLRTLILITIQMI